MPSRCPAAAWQSLQGWEPFPGISLFSLCPGISTVHGTAQPALTGRVLLQSAGCHMWDGSRGAPGARELRGVCPGVCSHSSQELRNLVQNHKSFS